MARHNPNGLTHAMHCLRLTSTLLNTSINASRPTLNTLRTRTYATEITPVPAAPPIDFDSFTKKPARIIPASKAYFSGSPLFIDQLLSLEALQAKYASLPTVSTAEAPRMAWFKLPQFRDFVGEPVPMKKYKSLLKILQQLNRIKQEQLPAEVRKVLALYLRPGNPYDRTIIPRTVDENGRARAKGKRKESTAVVQLVEGEGEVLVNGKNIVEVFKRVHDRESALWALRVTQRMDKYNVWVTAKGGGVTGQAEATTLAIGRALLLHEPGLKPVLRKGMFPSLLITDLLMIWTCLLTCISSQLVPSQSMPVVSRERSQAMSRPAKCPPGSSVKTDRAFSSVFVSFLFQSCTIPPAMAPKVLVLYPVLSMHRPPSENGMEFHRI